MWYRNDSLYNTHTCDNSGGHTYVCSKGKQYNMVQ